MATMPPSGCVHTSAIENKKLTFERRKYFDALTCELFSLPIRLYFVK